MDNFFIYTNQSKDKGLAVTKRVKDFLEKSGKKCEIAQFDEPLDKSIRQDSISFHADVPKDTQLCIVLGGDGTMLQAANNVRDLDIPLVGINLGTIGYLTEIDADEIESALKQIIEGNYEIEERMLLSGRKVEENFKNFEALNDIVIARKAAMQIITLKVYVNNQLITTYLADGVIVSTPTGSTGYNMSAGGPIVEPGSHSIVLTPICPHNLASRSIVLASSDRVCIELGSGKADRIQEAEASIDGKFGAGLTTGDKIEIYKSKSVTKILKLNRVSFLDLLHNKLG